MVHAGKRARKIQVRVPNYTDPWAYVIRQTLEEHDLVLLEGVVPPTNQTPYATLNSNLHKDAVVGQELAVFGHSSVGNYPTGQRFPVVISGFSEKDGRVGISGDINPGDSGGPVVDAMGHVVGIINAKDRVRDGQARFIPSSLLIDLLEGNHISFSNVVQTGSKREQQPAYAYNPFTWRKGITQAEAFFDRQFEQFTMRDFLHTGQNCQIVGPRRIGKTSLLLQIERVVSQWENNAVYAYVDLHDARCYQLVGWLETVSEKLLWRSPARSLADFNKRIEEMVSREMLLVLCLDEFEEFTKRREEFTRDFFMNLRHCGNLGMTIISASQAQLNELTDPDDPTSPFYNTFPPLFLGPFGDDDVHDFVSKLRPNTPSFDEEEKEAIKNFSRGFPLALQVACFHVLNSKKRRTSLTAALDMAARDLEAYGHSTSWRS